MIAVLISSFPHELRAHRRVVNEVKEWHESRRDHPGRTHRHVCKSTLNESAGTGFGTHGGCARARANTRACSLACVRLLACLRVRARVRVLVHMRVRARVCVCASAEAAVCACRGLAHALKMAHAALKIRGEFHSRQACIVCG
eukprot:544593-Pleurochrysis_carterae.AAC.3